MSCCTPCVWYNWVICLETVQYWQAWHLFLHYVIVMSLPLQYMYVVIGAYTCMHTHWQWCVGGSPMNVIICSLHKWLQVLLGNFAVMIIIIIIALLKEFFFEMTAYTVCYSDQTIAFCYEIRNNHYTIGIPRLTKTKIRMCVSSNND